MNTLANTTILIGNPALFQVESIICKETSRSSLFERLTISLAGMQFGDSSDCEIAGVNSASFIIAADRFTEMANKGVITNKSFMIGLGSNFDDYCFRVKQSSVTKLKLSVGDCRENKIVLADFKLPLNYFQLVCASYYTAVRDFKKAFEDR